MFRKWYVHLVLLLVCVTLAVPPSAAAVTPESGGVTLTVALPEPIWEGLLPTLTDMFLAQHPDIADIAWSLTDDATYEAFLAMKLSGGQLPDIIAVGAGEPLAAWHPHLLPIQAHEAIQPEWLTGSRHEQTLHTLPVAVYATGTLYNMDLLAQAGWHEPPQTRGELLALCEDMREAGLRPLMATYRDTAEWLRRSASQVLSLKVSPAAYAEALQQGLVDPFAGDADWNGWIEYMSITFDYGIKRRLRLNDRAAENYFFIEKYGILSNTTSRILISMDDVDPALSDRMALGPLLFSDDAGQNRLQADVVRLGISEHCQHPEAAQTFITWLATDPEAVAYLCEHMGILPVTDTSTYALRGLAQAMDDMRGQNRLAIDLRGIMPHQVAQDVEDACIRYIDEGSNPRDLLAAFQGAWEAYTNP